MEPLDLDWPRRRGCSLAAVAMQAFPYETITAGKAVKDVSRRSGESV